MAHLRRLPWRTLIPFALAIFGCASVALALAADLLGVGVGGFGAKQITLLALGVASLLSGLGLMTRAGWAYVTGWYQQMRAATAPAGILLVAIWFGLLTGWGQALVVLTRKEIQGQLIALGIDYGWMIPLANLVLLVTMGLVLHLLHRRWPRVVSVRTATFLLAWPATLGLLLLIPRVSNLALLVLAAGIAMQVARLAVKHNRGFWTMVRFSVGWPALLRRPRKLAPAASSTVAPASHSGPAAGVVPTRRQFLLGTTSGIAAVALGTQAGLAVTERRALARLVRPASRMPNVLLIVLDTVRAQSMSLYGYSRPTTPNLERLSAQGTLFARAIAPAPWTLPSHASMFTGRFPHELSANWWRPLDTAYPSLAEILSDHGYQTAGFVGNTLYCSREFGLSRGFAHYEDYPITPGQVMSSTSFGQTLVNDLQVRREDIGRKTAEQVNRELLRWLSRGNRAPFFAFLNYYDAHDPYTPPDRFALQFAGKRRPQDHLHRPPYRAEEVTEISSAYDGCLAYLDSQVETLLAEFRTRDILDDTLVVIASDHGVQFGEHGLMSHGNSLYLALLHVPLMLVFSPGVPQGTRISAPVSLRDLGATILELLGLEGEMRLPGKSLARHWRGSQAEQQGIGEALLSEVTFRSGLPSWYPVSGGDMKSLVSGRYHYIRNGNRGEELYDIEADPHEALNLAKTEASRSVIERLRTFLPQP